MSYDNARPDDPDYPAAVHREFEPDNPNIIVRVGSYVVNRDGDIVIATTSNAGPYPNEFLASINQPFFRARYLGNADDKLEYANQSRHCTIAEITSALGWRSGAFKADGKGQLQLL